MKPAGRTTIFQAIAAHPWASLRDGVVLSAVMAFSVLLAQQYDIFGWIKSLATPERTISPAEAVLLGCIAAGCIWCFIARRLHEAAADTVDPELVASEISILRELAMRDPLTGLPNRRVLLEALDLAMERPPLPGTAHAVFLLDLNGFKRVNDRYGHAAGDEVLRAVVGRFQRAARTDDVFARLGGDEFAVLARNVTQSDASAIGNRFIEVLSKSVRAGATTHDVGVAIGAALLPADGDTVEKILRHADVAMYRAKANEASSLVFFGSVVAADGLVRKASA